MSNKLVKMALAAFLVLMHAAAPAEDIDLFTGAPAGDSNVLFIIDNAANFSASATHGCTYVDGGTPSLGNTTGGMEQCALYNAIVALPNSALPLNLGLMAYNANGFVDWNGVKCDVDEAYGGCLMVPLTPMTALNKDKILAWIRTWGVSFNIKTNNQATGAVMQEAWAYFAGRTGLSGRSYADMKPTSTCGNNYVIFVGNAYNNSGSPGDQTGDKGPRNALEGTNSVADKNASPAATAVQKLIYEATITTMCGAGTLPKINQHEGGGFYADEWARYMANPATTNIATYTIGVHSAACKPEYAALLSSMATFGGGTYFPTTNFQQLKDAITTALSEIQSVNSAFASASLPVSVNAQGTYLNQIFVGMFRPEEQPRWYGNLKQYQFVPQFDAGGSIVGLKTADKNGVPIVSPLTGFVTPCAESFWSTAVDPYWPNDYLGNCLGSDVRYDSPDGEIVEKGGAAQKLRAVSGLSGAAARNVKTCDVGCGALAEFNSGNGAITKTLLGNAGMTDTYRTDLISWVRGQNLDNELSKGTSVMRPSVHGDVVHSRPLAIDYGGTTGVVVFYGGNDGMLRAINGNQASTDGYELWSFVAPEHYGKFNRLKTNSPAISFPSVDPSTTPTPAPKDYFFDGPIGVYSSGSTKWIYPTMRRGGGAVYAFDVSNPTNPALKWKLDGSQLTNIGQTWSEPKVVKVAGYPLLASTAKSPVIIMGGGYDTCEDLDAAPNTTCTAPKGNRVFVLDAEYGTLLQTFTTDRSVAADITVRDSDGDGLADIAYVVDTGANIYRINIGTSSPGSWSFSKIAMLGCNTAASCDRKFLHAPEVVVTEAYNAVLVGSGNRERPLLANKATLVDNAFFMIKDDVSVSSPAVITTTQLVAMDPNLEPTMTQKAELALSTNKGWYLAFGAPNADPNLDHDKEQVVTSAVVMAGVAYFSTHTPTVPAACGANLGRARGYAVNFLDSSSRDAVTVTDDPGAVTVTYPDGTVIVTYPDGTVVETSPDGIVVVTYPDGTVVVNNPTRFSEFAGGGLAPSPVTGIVEIETTVPPPDSDPDASPTTTTVKVVFGIGVKPPSDEPGSGIEGSQIEVDVSPVRSRVYWYIQQ